MSENDSDYQKIKDARTAFIAGALESWANILENKPEKKSYIIEQMKFLALSLKKSAKLTQFEK